MLQQPQVALVTGSGRGIGQAVAMGLARKGFDVVVNSTERSSHEAIPVVEAIRAMGRRSIHVPCDVSDEASVKAMFQKIKEELGPVSVLVANAGIQQNMPFLEIDMATFDRIIGVNLRGCFLCCQEAAKQMKELGHGKIVTVSSIRANRMFPGAAAYSASKGGIEALTKVMAVELAPFNIQVNCFQPGAVETAFNRDVLSDPDYRRLATGRIPAGFIAVPDQVVEPVLFFCLPGSEYVTGAVLTVDGGQSPFAGSSEDH